MVSKYNYLERELIRLKRQNFYRTIKAVNVNGSTAIVNGKESIHFSSNDYLGLSQNKDILRKVVEQLRQISQCSSRLIAGNDPKFIELEEHLSKHRGTESSLVFPTGYMANLGAITTLADKDTTIFSDELNHASIIDACRLSSARIKVFGHNDSECLQRLMQYCIGKKIVITEGIFSINGDISKLQQICDVAKSNNAIVVLDDAHGDFILGSRHSFSGTSSYLGVNNMIDIHISSLSKALGCFGGYVAASRTVREILINKSRQFIYTSALPEHLCISAILSIPLAKKGNLQKRLFDNIKMLSHGLKKLGFLIGDSTTQIIPLMVGDEKLAVEFSDGLLKNCVFAQPIRYPTVKKGSACLRISLTSLHKKNQLVYALDVFEKVGKRYNMI
ncbi:MAG: pyridoxal phosphate-dependent aminotransferase family protein [Thermoproteota archaeon]|nr:pyridoxal phosphate-dependent aminotransferase family protein [Thermoproteota archaeon]